MLNMERSLTSGAFRALGVLILGRKRPGFDQEWNQIVCRQSLAALASLGYVCIGADVPVVDDATMNAALDKIQQAGCAALVMLQPSIGNGQLALTVSQRWADPIILWATPERPGDGKVSSCSLVGQHVWASLLRQAGHPFEFVYGDAEDATVRAALLRAIALANTVANLRLAKVGVIGTHAPGFVDLAADPFLLRKSMGIQLHPLSLPQYIERVQSVSEEDVKQDVQRVLDLQLPMNGVTADGLAINSRCYLAILQAMAEESLDALALQCWPEIPNMLGQWPYLAISRLSSEGHAIAIEGDVDGCIGSLINCLLGLGPGFLTDWLEHDQSTIFFWHPGMAPMNMCNAAGSDGGGITLAAHFNVAKPYVVDGRIRADEPVTITRLWRCDNRYHMTAFEGRTVTPRRNITGNSVLVEVAEPDVPRRFDCLLHAGMPHHVLLVFGSHGETLRRLARMLRLEWWA
jgi:L-fucose isomerase-like protein